MGKYQKITLIAGSLIILLVVLSVPLPKDNFERSKSLYDKKGNMLGARIASDGQWRFSLNGAVPEKLISALTTFEDKRFDQHFGVDPISIARALKENLSSGKVLSGGSTITQQVVRILRRNPSRTYKEKAIEALIAIKLDLLYSKEEIMKMYLENAPYGGNIVGAETASWFYFKRPLTKLSWAESALLAVLPNSPGLINLGKNRNRLLRKRNRLLKKLHEEDYFDQSTFELSLKEEIPPRPGFPKRFTPQLLGTLAATYPKQDIFHSTLDFNIQTKLMNVTKTHSERLKNKRILNLSTIIIDNQSGEVVGYVGNESAEPSSASFVDIARMPRSTGSILKPFLYMAMLDDGSLTPKTLVYDIPTYYRSFKPINFDKEFRGAIRADEALARSLNIPAVRMLNYYGIPRFHDYLKKLGFTSFNRSFEEYGLTLIIGGGEASLWELTKIYSYMAQNALGKPIKKIHELVLPKSKVSDFPSSPGASYLTAKALTEVNRPETESYWKSFESSQFISWKTGTSNGYRDAWAIGFTPRYTVGVWVGNASGIGQPDIVGTRSAAPVMFDVFNFLNKVEWFSEPVGQIKSVEVCKNSGFLASPICEKTFVDVPVKSHFDRIDTYHKVVHLSRKSGKQVHSQCANMNEMEHKTYFYLPPFVEYYYSRHHSEYKKIPRFDKRCGNSTSHSDLSIVYPDYNTEIYIPKGLDGDKKEVVLRSVHRNSSETLFWHINDKYIGKTSFQHQMSVKLPAGEHILTVVDLKGYQKRRKFKVISQ